MLDFAVGWLSVNRCDAGAVPSYPLQCFAWLITAWRRHSFLAAVDQGKCAAHAGKVNFYPVGALASQVIKAGHDSRIANVLCRVMVRHNMAFAKRNGSTC